MITNKIADLIPSNNIHLTVEPSCEQITANSAKMKSLSNTFTIFFTISSSRQTLQSFQSRQNSSPRYGHRFCQLLTYNLCFCRQFKNMQFHVTACFNSGGVDLKREAELIMKGRRDIWSGLLVSTTAPKNEQKRRQARGPKEGLPIWELSNGED